MWLDSSCTPHGLQQYSNFLCANIQSQRLSHSSSVSGEHSEIAAETFSIQASVSGEWQMTASVTNESSVQLHLFNALLWRAKPQQSIC